MQHNGWDHALKVTAEGTGLVGHAGAVLLRKAADHAGLTAGLGAALRKAGQSPLLDRGTVLVATAVAIALGATSMSDIALLAHLAPVLGTAPSGPTVRRALGLAGTPAMLDRIARARYLTGLRALNFPNVQPGPDIMPASIPYQGGTLTIFSRADWSKYAGSRRPSQFDITGFIYYLKTKPPRRRANNRPPQVPGPGAQQNQNDKQTPKQNPASTNTQGPTDEGAVSESWAGDLITLGASLVVVAAVAYLLPGVVAGGLLVGAADLVGGSEAVGTIASVSVDFGSEVVDGLGSLVDDVGSFL